MNIVIVTEKPAVSRAVAPLARKYWPSGNITLINAMPYGNIQFCYPRGLKLSQYPLVTEPRYRLQHWGNWMHPPYVVSEDGTLTTCTMSAELFTTADCIVNACYADPAGVAVFDVLMNEVLGKGYADNCPSVDIVAMDSRSLEQAFANAKPYGEVCAGRRAAGLLKRYFDWNWNVNSLAVFGTVQRELGVPPTAPALSKYALQLLYGLRDRNRMDDSDILKLMMYWPGTGKYPPPRGMDGGLGGPASRAQIVENLRAAGYLARTAVGQRTMYGVTPLGRSLLSCLHPDCQDADLCFRLDAWCASAGDASTHAVDRYIRTVFGKQLRFMGAAPVPR